MIGWLIGAWSQIWPNLAASAISTTAAFAWHHRRVRRLLADYHDELKRAVQGV